MLKSHIPLINNISKIVVMAFCTISTIMSAWYLYSDMQYYEYNYSRFSMWQIPLFQIITGVLFFYYLWLLYKKKYTGYILISIFFSLFVLFFPYEKYGDFKKLRLISLCESDGRLCKENLYPHINKQWCLENGYSFNDETRFCKMRNAD